MKQINEGELYPNGVEIGKGGNVWVNCRGCHRRQTAAVLNFTGKVYLPMGWTAGTGIDRSVLCPQCSIGLEKANNGM